MGYEHLNQEQFAHAIKGKTVHTLSGTRYRGALAVSEARPHDTTWTHIRSASGVEDYTRPADTFDSEDEARTAAKSRRKPRQAKQLPQLYGDFAQLAAFNGMLKKDGTAKRKRSDPE